MGLIVNHMTGIEGQVELVGYKAVVAMFLRWTLERRGESGSGQPIWILRASLSYQKDSFLLNASIPKVIRIKSQLGEWTVEPLPGVHPGIDKVGKYVIEGALVCPVEQKRQ